MGSHPERLVAASQSREDSVRQRLRKILIERAVRVEAKRFQHSERGQPEHYGIERANCFRSVGDGIESPVPFFCDLNHIFAANKP